MTTGIMRWLNRYIWGQHRHPVAYMDHQTRTSNDSEFWLRGLLFIATLVLAYAWVLEKSRSPQVFLFGFIVAFLTLSLSVALVTITLGSASPDTRVWLRFWGSYITSAPILSAYLLCGLGLVFPSATLMAWGVLLPFLLGVFIVDALAIWSDARLRKLHRLVNQNRNGALNGALPELAQHRNARRIRLGLVILAFTIGFGAVLIDRFWWPGTVAALAFVAGLIRLDAILLAGLGAKLLNDKMWPTFSSRNSLLLPATILERAFNTPGPEADPARIMALLRGSALGPSILGWLRKLPEAQINHHLLYLSFQPGGAVALNYLHPSLPAPIRPWNHLLSLLATEATKPDDLQRWISALVRASDCLIDPIGQQNLERSKIAEILLQTRRIFLTPFTPEQLTGTETALQDWVDSLQSNDEGSLSQRWPEILLAQVLLRSRLHGHVPPRQNIGGFM